MIHPVRASAPRTARKLFSLLLILAVLLGACASETPTLTPTVPGVTLHPTARPRATRTSTPVQTPTLTTTPDPGFDMTKLKGVQVDFWHPWVGDLAMLLDEFARDYTSSNPWGIVVRARSLGGNQALREQVETPDTPTSDTAPEVVVAPPEVLAGWMTAGRLVDLKPYLADPALSASDGGKPGDIQGDINPLFWQQGQDTAASLNGIPAQRTAWVIFYNQTWANELGFKQPPHTPQEFAVQACAAAKANQAAYFISLHGTGGYLVDHAALTALSWLAAFGADPLPSQGKQLYTFDNPQARSALQFLRKLFSDGCAWEGRNPSPQEYFANRMALFYSGSLQDIAFQTATQDRLKSKDQWVVLPYPAENGKPFVFSSGSSYGIIKSNPEAQAAAWLFIRWLSAPHQQALLSQLDTSFPIGNSAAKQFTDYSLHFPWSSIFPMLGMLRPAPELASWRTAQSVLEDAAWQIYRTPDNQIQFILPQVDQMIRELLSRP